MSSEPAIHRLLLLRHGESVWNEQGLFTGWVDVGLSERGSREAVHAGELLAARDLLPDVVHTSLLRRAIRTTELALEAAGREWIPVARSWRLNERHYGALQGKSKEQTRLEYGDEQYMLWRRSYDVRRRRSRRPPTLPPHVTRGMQGWHPTPCRIPSVWRMSSFACSRTGTTRSSPICSTRGSSSCRRTATLCERSSSTSTGSPTRRSPSSPADGRAAPLRAERGLRPLGRVDPRFGVSGTYLDLDAASASIAGVKSQGRAAAGT